MQLCASLRYAGRVGLLLLIIVGLQSVHAGSATWDINPPTNDWNTATNWTPDTVPNSPDDTATFDITNVHDIVIHSDVELNTLVFTDLSYSATITVGDSSTSNVVSFTLSGTGIVKNSQFQLYYVEAAPTLVTNGARNTVFLENDVSSAQSTFLRAIGGTSMGSTGGQIQFLDDSTLGPGYASAFAGENGGDGGEVWFLDNSTASKVGGISNGQVQAFASGAGSTPGIVIFKGNSNAVNAGVSASGATAAGVEGGKVFFLESSNGGTLHVSAFSGGGSVPDASGGMVTFSDTASAGSAIVSAFGSGVSQGGTVQFLGDSSGGTAQVEVTRHNGRLVISRHNPPGITIGSLEGNGRVILGSNELTVGSNNLSTEFTGIIVGSGSVTKIGTGTLTLGESNIYTGTTTVSGGGLNVTNSEGTGTGTGDLRVVAGSLGGNGIIAGPVTVGTGRGGEAFLAPSFGTNGVHSPSTLTIQSALTFQADGTYSYGLKTTTAVADQVMANGVTIKNGARFALTAAGNQKLPVGSVFIAISNTNTRPIGGTFNNLPDGAIVTVRVNNFQATYSGGDGNDLTLTVVPIVGTEVLEKNRAGGI